MKKIVLLYINLFSFLSAYTQDLEWLQQLNGASNNDLTVLNQIKLDEEGNIYLLGCYTDTVNFDLKNGSYKVIPKRKDVRTFFLAKYDKSRNLKWIKSFETNHIMNLGHNYFDVSFSVVENQNIILGIGFERRLVMNNDTIDITSNGWSDFALVKLDKNGKFLWYKTYGGKKDDYLFRNILYQNNRYIIHGRYGDTIDFGEVDRFGSIKYMSGGQKLHHFLASIDTSGNTQWVKTLKSTINFTSRNIRKQKDGSFVMVGWYIDSVYFSDSSFWATKTNKQFNAFIIKYSSSGDILWSKNIECNGERNYLYGLDIDEDDNIYTSGYFTGEVLLKNGNNVFKKYNLKNYDLLLMKLDKNGTFLWTKHIEGGRRNSFHCELAVTDQISLAGEYADSLVFDEGNDKWILKSYNRRNGFVAFLDLNGKLKTATTYKEANPTSISNSSYITDIMEKDNQVYVLGNFTAKVDFSPTQNKSIMDAKESQFNGFIAKYSKRIIPKDSLVNNPETLPNIGIKDSRHQHFSIYPNPFTDKIQIENPKSEKFSVQLTDLQGKMIAKSQTISSKSYTLELDKNLPKGLYFLEIKTESETSFHKMLKVE